MNLPDASIADRYYSSGRVVESTSRVTGHWSDSSSERVILEGVNENLCFFYPARDKYAEFDNLVAIFHRMLIVVGLNLNNILSAATPASSCIIM